MRLRRPDMASILAEADLDQPDQLEECGVGAVAARVDGDAVAFRGAEHHQPHDRRAGDAVAALFNLNGDGFGQAADECDEFGAGARVKTALIGDLDGLRQIAQRPTPSISDATAIYFCPASRAAITAGRNSMEIGRSHV